MQASSSILIIALGLFIILSGEKNKTKWAAFWLALITGGSHLLESWLDIHSFVFNTVSQLSIYGYPILGAFTPALLVHFHFMYPKPFRWAKRRILWSLYIPSIFFVYLSCSLKYIHSVEAINYKTVISYTPYYLVYGVYAILGFAISLSCLVLRLRSSTGQEKKHIKQLLTIEIVLTLSSVLGYYVRYITGFEAHLYDVALVIFFGVIAYAIVRYQAFSIRTAAHYSLLWIASTLVVLVPIILVPLAIENQSNRFPIFVQLSIYGVFSILYYVLSDRFIFPIVRRTLIRRNRELTARISSVRTEIENAPSGQELKNLIAKEIRENLYANDVFFCFEENLELFMSVGVNIVRDHVMPTADLDWMPSSVTVANRHMILDMASEKSTIKDRIHLIMRLQYNGRSFGYLLLGEKKTLKEYDYEEISFLETILSSACATINRLEISWNANRMETIHKLKTNLFVNLAHEIKTPLTLINNSLNSFSKRVGESAELIEMKYNISRLLRDAVNFLDSEKLERGQPFYDNDTPIDLSEMLTRKIQSFAPLAAKKQIVIKPQRIDSHLYSKIDPYAFDRIVNNLLDNAIKYNRPLGSISVYLTSANDEIHFVVEDTGIGITEEDQKAIFDPYYQSLRAKRNVQGIGMGLYIVAQIVKSVKGSINVSSQLNSWSKFEIELKKYNLKQGEKILSTGSISEPINVPPEYDCSDIFSEKDKGTLLLVEDNVSLLHSLRSAFSEEYNILCSENGEEALQKLEKYKDRRPDLVISDVMMDKMDGNAFYAAFRQKEEFLDVPFIFLTAKSVESENVEALTKGAIDYVYKPFSMEVLRAKVKSLIEFSNIKKMLFAKDKFHSLGILTASISHEILNPLSGIVGLLFVLEGAIKDQSNPEISQAIDFIKSNASRINETVLTMRSLFNGDVLRVQKISAFEVLGPIIRLFADKTKERIKFIEKIPENITLSTNSNALTQIMSNLLSNSIDSISNKGLITVSLAQKENHALLSIGDTGSGIDPKYQKNIFELGFTKKNNGNGTGLGLYIVKELCANLNISIAFESVVGRGTTFTLAFPSVGT
jgi:signal transduction histidine kinase